MASARALAVEGMALGRTHSRPGRRAPKQLDTEVSPKEQPLIAFQPSFARIGMPRGWVIDRTARPRKGDCAPAFGLPGRPLHEALAMR